MYDYSLLILFSQAHTSVFIFKLHFMIRLAISPNVYYTVCNSGLCQWSRFALSQHLKGLTGTYHPIHCTVCERPCLARGFGAGWLDRAVGTEAVWKEGWSFHIALSTHTAVCITVQYRQSTGEECHRRGGGLHNSIQAGTGYITIEREGWECWISETAWKPGRGWERVNCRREGRER